MRKQMVFLVGLALLGATAWAGEEKNALSACLESLSKREALTGDWFGLKDQLDERGLAVRLGATQVYQANVRGGLSTHRRAGRYAGSYDLELEADLERSVGLTGGSMYVLAEGSWSEGLDASSVGSLFGVDADAAGDRAIDLTELWFEQAFFEGRIRVRVGKQNLTGGFECAGCPVSFDASLFANDETTQFLNGGLVNNPAIPFPESGLGVVVYVQPLDWLYVSAGVADADADARETGFSTTFGGPGNFFSVYEAGLVPLLPSPSGPLRGAYRVGLWYDPRPKDRLDGAGTETDDLGFYLSLDQVLWRERAEEDDQQGLGLFFRFGWADATLNEIEAFWSLGAQYRGLVPGRDDDALGFGVARGLLGDRGDLTASHETAMEVYYNCQVTPWLGVSPSVQVVLNPGGDAAVDTAVVLGVRVQLAL